MSPSNRRIRVFTLSPTKASRRIPALPQDHAIELDIDGDQDAEYSGSLDDRSPKHSLPQTTNENDPSGSSKGSEIHSTNKSERNLHQLVSKHQNMTADNVDPSLDCSKLAQQTPHLYSDVFSVQPLDITVDERKVQSLHLDLRRLHQSFPKIYEHFFRSGVMTSQNSQIEC